MSKRIVSQMSQMVGALLSLGIVLFMLACHQRNEERKPEQKTDIPNPPKTATGVFRPPNDSCIVRIQGLLVRADTLKRGVGFFVNDVGHIVTARHVVDSLKGIELKLVGGRGRAVPDSAESPMYSQKYDIAVIKHKSSRSPSYRYHLVKLAPSASPIVAGTPVEVLTFNHNDALERILCEMESDKKGGWRLNGPKCGFVEGCSGSPVFAGDGTALGSLTAVRVCVDTIYKGREREEYTYYDYQFEERSHIKDFLLTNSVLYDTADIGTQGSVLDTRKQGNPVTIEERSWFIGMLDLIKSSLEDVLQNYDQFRGRDTDILIDTYFETSSFLDKMTNESYLLSNGKRRQAIFFFIKGLAIKASHQRSIEASRQYFERAVYEDSFFADARYQIALYHLRCTGDTAVIIKHLRKALELEPENGEVLRVLGMYYLQCREAILARKFFEKARPFLREDDPRIPFYFGVSYDPYWSIVAQLYDWISNFPQVYKREPIFWEVQNKRQELLNKIPNRDKRLKSAIAYYKESLSLRPAYIRPLNAIIWDIANEALENSLSDSLRIVELQQYLNRMSTFVGYGLVDPRSFNTLALGYTALNDCKNACKYWLESMKAMKDIQLSSAYESDLKRENERVSTMCACTYELFEQRGLK